MHRRVAILLGVMFSLLVMVPVAGAQPLDSEGMMGLFPQQPELNEPVTRAEFAAMLCEAASIELVKGSTVSARDVDGDSWYAEALATLAQKEVMVGYPDGTFRPQQPVTGLEAGILAARALGLSETVSPAGTDSPLERTHWGSSVYSWLLDQGLISAQANPEGHITIEEAAAFLATVFGCDEEAVAIVEKAQKSAATVADISFAGSMQMIMKPRAGAETAMPLVQGSTQMTMEMILPDTFHQCMRMQFEGLPAGNGAASMPTIEMEQYLVDGSMYIQTVNPISGETQWICLPGEALPDLKALMEESLQANIGVPEELRKYFHYQLLGTTEKNGHSVYEIGYYGRIDDLEAFMRLALPESMRSLMEGALEEGIKEAGKMYKSISYWGKDYIGVEDNLSHASEVKMVMVFNDEFQGEPVPVELIEMHMRADKLEYNTGVKIELPLEALQAPEMFVPAESPAPTA